MTIYDEIRAERERQDAQFGDSALLSENYLIRLIQNCIRYTKPGEHYRRRMLQVAALAVAACKT